ncbi:MAG TPA: CGNR zinc finger domain-containing protein [Hyphomicrobiales bacterium]|nr:CGNR zinc finger domain-containing protein [Hyphomicrobiales bacterium]
MKLSDKYSVPRELAALYDFVNSLDLRRYREQGVQHTPSDALASRAEAEAWMQAHGLLVPGHLLSEEEYRRALALRQALRAFLEAAPAGRNQNSDAGKGLEIAAAAFPLLLRMAQNGLTLSPKGANRLGRVLAELYRLAETGQLDRLKMCDSPECRWVFFDRSKPANRRWCSSDRCGNRQKVRTYRERHRSGSGGQA